MAAVIPAGGVIQGTGITFWGYHWATLQGFSTLSAWVGGLDCGDITIAGDGSVTVLWNSDPDKLLTPAFLVALSNAPPTAAPAGFREAATNIDLYFTYGGGATAIVRITVDVVIGLVYNSDGQTVRPNGASAKTQQGPALGETRRAHMFGVLMANSGTKVSFGVDAAHLTAANVVGTDAGQVPLVSSVFKGVWWDTIDSDYDFDGMLMWRMTRPYPMTIVSYSGFIETDER